MHLDNGQVGCLDTKGFETDFTIAPLQNQRFSSTNASWLLNTRKDVMKICIVTKILVGKGLSSDGVVGVAMGTVFQEIRPGAGFKTR